MKTKNLLILGFSFLVVIFVGLSIYFTFIRKVAAPEVPILEGAYQLEVKKFGTGTLTSFLIDKSKENTIFPGDDFFVVDYAEALEQAGWLSHFKSRSEYDFYPRGLSKSILNFSECRTPWLNMRVERTQNINIFKIFLTRTEKSCPGHI